MAKQERKSITDIIAAKTPVRKPSAEEIDKITNEIHQTSAVKNEDKSTSFTDSSSHGKIKRISVNAPVSLYIKAKTKATMRDETLMAYIIRLIEQDV